LKIVIAIILFSIIILFHELGHFLLAKKNKIRVNEFCLGLGPTLIGFTKGETKYSIKLLPFGGACMMEGEDGDSTTDGAFNSKSVWARIAVVAAGPIFNFIMAFVFAVILIACVGYDAPKLSGVMDGYAAKEAGLQSGDSITKINGKNIHFASEIGIYGYFHPGETWNLVYERDGKNHSATLVPKYDEKSKAYLVGIQYNFPREKTNAIGTLKYGAYEVKYWIDVTMESLKYLVTGKVSVNELSGPVGIVKNIGDTYDQSKSEGALIIVMSMLNWAILLSANLGVMNLLPIPALDGGRLVFLIVEAITRKRIDSDKEGMVHFIGFVLLMGLMVVVMFNDIRKLF
jgi:regulator of sigma E protease